MTVDDRLEYAANWQTLELVRRFARSWQDSPGWSITDLTQMFRHVAIQEIPLPPDLFGFVVGLGVGCGDETWRVSLNDRLPLAASNSTRGHEIGHTFQALGLGVASCAPRQGLPVVEQEAHAIGALLVVPFAAVRSLRLGDCATSRSVATELHVPLTYVEIRNALAVFLGEKRGLEEDASAYLNWAMLGHQRWQSRISDYMAALAV